MGKNDLIEKLKRDPIYLVLGQDYFTGENLLLEKVRNEYGLSLKAKSHDVFLEIKETNQLEWLKTQAELIVEPKKLEIIKLLPWNGVITSSVDGLVERVFRNNWREVIPIYNADNKIIGRLSDRNKLSISFLYGTLNSDLSDAHLPLSQLEFVKAKSNAVRLLSKYTLELISPLGTIIIDSYNPNNDWLDVDTLLPLLLQCKEGQVHYFGQNISDMNPLWKQLVELKIIVEHEQSFAEYLLEEESNGNINFDELVFDRDNSRRIMIKKKSYAIPKNMYNKVSKNAVILDDTILSLSEYPDSPNEEFRLFLHETSIKPVWEGYKWGFCFERDIEANFVSKINEQITKDFDTMPIILEGQPGAGKSVILGKIAYHYKIEYIYPVLFISKSVKIINYNDILEFCEWAEIQNKADRVIIIWDSSIYNDEISKYIELNNYLTSAGRKVLIIGSSLKLSEKTKKSYLFESIEISADLSDKEKDNICEVFNKFSGSGINREVLEKYSGGNILNACYRLLPPSRMSIRTGIIDEANKNQTTLKQILKKNDEDYVTAFEKAFWNAGIYVNSEVTKRYVDFEKIIDYICVPAQFDINIPFDIILRCFDSEHSLDVATVIDEIDFFRFTENSSGEWEVGTRNRLEAEIVAQSLLSSTQKQVDIIIAYIYKINISDNYLHERRDLDFLIELLKEIGPNGKSSEVFMLYYKQIADALEEIRNSGIWDGRTILQESLLLREYAKKAGVTGNKHDLIEKSQKLVKEEIKRIKKEVIDSDGKIKHLGRLYGELASNLGAQITEILKQKQFDVKIIFDKYIEFEESLQYVRSYLPDSFHALDICAWTSLKIIDNETIPMEIKTKVLTNSIAMYDEAEMTYPEFCKMEEYNTRRFQLESSHESNSIAEEYFQNLIGMKSGAGIYLKASMMLSMQFNKKLSKDEIDRCSKALEFMLSYGDIVYNDMSCLYLMFKLKWFILTGHPIIYIQKQSLQIDDQGWENLLELINRILEKVPDRTNAVLKYVKAIALFHLGKKKQYLGAFYELQHIYYPFNRRITINYLASNQNGEVKSFTGSIVSLTGDKKTIFHINELGIDVPYFNSNFARAEHAIGENFEKLELGFNFLGIQVSKTHVSGGR